jgi:hypothetical protein
MPDEPEGPFEERLWARKIEGKHASFGGIGGQARGNARKATKTAHARDDDAN